MDGGRRPDLIGGRHCGRRSSQFLSAAVPPTSLSDAGATAYTAGAQSDLSALPLHRHRHTRPWSVFALPLVVILRYGVVAREERYLEQRFGDAYRDYKARVRRWL